MVSVVANGERALQSPRKLLEVIGDPYLPAPLPTAPRRTARVEWNQLGYRFPGLADDDVFTSENKLNEPGEVSLGVVDVVDLDGLTLVSLDRGSQP